MYFNLTCTSVVSGLGSSVHVLLLFSRAVSQDWRVLSFIHHFLSFNFVIHLSFHLFTWLSSQLSLHLPISYVSYFTYLSTYLHLPKNVHLFVNLPFHLFICLSFQLIFIYLFLYPHSSALCYFQFKQLQSSLLPQLEPN